MKTSVIACLISLVLAVASVTSGHAQSPAQIFETYKQAIVKIAVTGLDAEGRTRTPIIGSGFIVYSDKYTLMLTAAHLLGSNSRHQSSNPDWQVTNGRIERKIKIEGLDEHGRLVEFSPDASVFPVEFPNGVDVAVLSIKQRNFLSVKLPT